MVVVIFHFMEMVIGDYSKLFIGHGWLAVDFFFCLSGFVIGFAYDDRVEAMGFWAFLKVRLIRLHPLVIFGSVLFAVVVSTTASATRGASPGISDDCTVVIRC